MLRTLLTSYSLRTFRDVFLNRTFHLTNWLPICTEPVCILLTTYLYCLCGDDGLMLVARSLGKARNSSPSMFWLLSLWCKWSCVLSALRTAARAFPRQRDSSLDLTWGHNPVGLVTAGVMPMKQPIKAGMMRQICTGNVYSTSMFAI